MEQQKSWHIKKTIIQTIEKGSLKMVCISNMIQAVKIMWLKR